MARWWLHNTMSGYMLEVEAERRAEAMMYRLQEACAGHGGDGESAYVRMMTPRVKDWVAEFAQSGLASP